LYRASRHESGKILGPNIIALHELAETGRLTVDDLRTKLWALGRHYVKDLQPYMDDLSRDLMKEIQGVVIPAKLDTTIEGALIGAKLHFLAWQLLEVPNIIFIRQHLGKWSLPRHSAMVKVIFQEWFFNCLKEISSLEKADATITVEAQIGLITVVSPGRLLDEDVETLTGPPSQGEIDLDAHGLVLIRDIAYYAFGSRVLLTQADGDICFSLPLPLVSTHE